MNGSVRGYVAGISLKGCGICDNIVSLKTKTKKQSQVFKGTNQARLGPHCVLGPQHVSVCSPRAKIKLGPAIGAVQTLPYFHL